MMLLRPRFGGSGWGHFAATSQALYPQFSAAGIIVAARTPTYHGTGPTDSKLSLQKRPHSKGENGQRGLPRLPGNRLEAGAAKRWRSRQRGGGLRLGHGKRA